MNTKNITTPIKRFAHAHDDLPAFHAAYLILALLAAGLFNLGAFGLIIVAHMSLDWVKYREVHSLSYKETMVGMLRESIVDITLLVVGLVFAVYLHHSVGVASVSGLMRAELSVLRTAAIMIPKVKILHHFLKIIAHLRHYLEHLHPHLREKFGGIDYLCFYFCGISLMLILFAAPLMGIPFETVQHILAEELIPWRI